MKYAVFDYDFVAFAAASLGEERSILVQHPSGIEESFKTRTDFYGHWSKKEGGWLAKYNADKAAPLLPDEFTITDVQDPNSFGFVSNIVKAQVESVCKKLELPSKAFYGWVGRGPSWREEASTLIKYKDNRVGLLRPVHLNAAKDLLVRRYNAEWQEHLEVDDRTVMECYKDPDRVLVAIDKDAMGTGCSVFNPDKMDSPQDCDTFGKIFLDDTGEVRGYGRKFFYFQCAYGDSSDHYFSNSASNVKWGKKSAFNALVGCKTDMEAWQELVNVYKKLYPEPVEWAGWRGDVLTVDWLYALQENVTMAHMLRWEGDGIDVQSVLSKMKVNF